ncbi:MAG: 6-bladed beta-propeller, partial [Gammaproteobacteria bacterium]|nr:6-bladed beta-propeller [Gammaproteobacteria bacterium]
EERHMVRPMAVVSMSEQEIYVADPGARGVHYFNRKRNEYRLIQQADNQPLPSPVGLARGPNHSVLVADSELGGIFIIQPGGDTASPLVLDVRLAQPTGIARDQATGRMYVTDTAGHSFSIFDQHGKRLKQIGKRGNGKAEFNFPTLMWLDKERLYVTDSLNFRIQMFDHDGVFKGFFGQIGTTTGTLSRPKGVATDNFGHIYTVDSLFHALQIFNDQGQLLLNIGRQGGLPGEFWLPTGLYISENNTIYIADSHNRRVQVFQYIGGKS